MAGSTPSDRRVSSHSVWGEPLRTVAGAASVKSQAPAAVLGGSPQTLWDDTLRSLGVDPAMLQPGGGVN